MANLKKDSKNAYISVRMNDEIKHAAERIFYELGISTSEAVNVFFREVINNNGIPFEISNPYSRLTRRQKIS